MPPPVGVQSSQPTLPGSPAQSGTTYLTLSSQRSPSGSAIGLLEPSHPVIVTGKVTGRTVPSPANARGPVRAAALAADVHWFAPRIPAMNVSKSLCVLTSTPSARAGGSTPTPPDEPTSIGPGNRSPLKSV